jgi:hypothetical protein
MKYAVALVAVIAALTLAPMQAELAEEEVTLTGEPVDMNCYLGGKSGEGHAACAKACAGKGNPIGFVVEEGDKKQLYLVLGGGGKAAKDLMAEHMGTEVDAIGKVAEKDGLKVITVSEVLVEEEWFPEEAPGSASIKKVD